MHSLPTSAPPDASGAPRAREAVVEQLRSHIQAVASRYKGRIHAWDVVNEVIDNDGSYRPTTWVRAIGNGDELVKLSFRFAQQYASYMMGAAVRKSALVFTVSEASKTDILHFYPEMDADRVQVVYSGRLVGDVPRGSTDPYELGRLMTGVGA